MGKSILQFYLEQISFRLSGVKDQQVPDRKSVTDLGVELILQNPNPVL